MAEKEYKSADDGRFLYAVITTLAVYMIIGSFAQFLCTIIGFAYPAYASVKAIRTSNKDEEIRWLIYWTNFAVFSLTDFFSEIIVAYFPGYWLLKISFFLYAFFLLYLYLPQTNGAFIIYNKYVDPSVAKIDEIVSSYTTHICST
ncbi:unnamed protein product [Dracunculus medinensis]|uniref:Receptor expression-enhancing protein n=1 Tax=Dracunculus medinensis TaxID=318479 RepID=A0A0N4US59_DRAME|nr:unnamed protein product [Dracunculus medinensis]